MPDILAISQSMDDDMRVQDYVNVLQKTQTLLQSVVADGRWRWIIFRSVALSETGQRQDAIRLMHDYLAGTYDREVLKHISRMILGEGAPFSEVAMLRGLFERHARRLDDDELRRFKAETDYHFGEREKALAEMRRLPVGTVPEHYFETPAPENVKLRDLVADVHAGRIENVDRDFEDVRKSIVPGTVDDMRLVSIVGRLERHQRVRDRLKACVAYQISGAKLPQRPLLVETMLYSGEEHLLDLHLHSMPFVDHFIVVQGDHSFTGIQKATHAVVDNPRFAAFAHKITSIVIRFASFNDPFLKFPWFVEAVHRNAAHATILGERENDIHIVSDVDEVLRQATIDAFKTSGNEIATVRLREHKFFLNFQRFGVGDYRQMTLPTLATLSSGSVHRAVDPQTIRNFMSRDLTRQRAQIYDGGWHFSSVVDAKGLAAKYSNYSHVENTTKRNNIYLFEQFLEDMMAGRCSSPEKKQYYGERGLPLIGYMAMPITTQTYPEYMVDNPQMFWNYTLPFPKEEEWLDVITVLNRRGQ